MNFEIRRADSSEAVALAALDQKMFPVSDYITTKQWGELTSFWIRVDGKIVGSIGLEPYADDGSAPFLKSLHVASIGLLPKFQGKGLGSLAQQWEINYAKAHGFKRIVAHCRASNEVSLHLHQKFGFKVVGEVPHSYHEPEESAITLELLIP